MSSILTVDDLAKITRDWDAKSKERAYTEFTARQNGERKVWYCAPDADGMHGRYCDGMPHAGYDYNHARADQWPPPGSDWFTWALVGGRGSGKTRSGAEFTRKMSEKVGRLCLIAPTNADVRDTMVTGESGLQAVFAHAGQKIDYQPSKKRIVFPSGAIAGLFSGEEPDRLRGPQHGFAWADEPAHYEDPQAVWDMMLLGLRLGDPHIALTTTPLPTKFMKERLAEEDTRVSRVSTYANLANLAEKFKKTVLDRYEGTRLGKQELHGEILEDVEGALWQEKLILRSELQAEAFERIIVAIDPAGTANRRSDLTGIVVVAKIGRLYYVLEDLSDKYSPTGWAQKALAAYKKWHADAIVVEKNYGGDMVKTTIESEAKEQKIECRVLVTTAVRGKQLRAEPIVALYEQARFFHNGKFQELEDEMLTWVPGEGDSPNRIDALVWGATELSGNYGPMQMAAPTGRIKRSGPQRPTGPNRRWS